MICFFKEGKIGTLQFPKISYLNISNLQIWQIWSFRWSNFKSNINSIYKGGKQVGGWDVVGNTVKILKNQSLKYKWIYGKTKIETVTLPFAF